MRSNDWESFAARMAEIRDLSNIVALLSWDQETHMPKKGMAARAEQLATLQGLHHERIVDTAVGDLIADLESSGDLSELQSCSLREFKFDRERATKVPVELVKEIARAQASALSAWGEARKVRDFRLFAPELARLLELRREIAD